MTGILHVCTANLCRSPMAERLCAVAVAARFGAQGVMNSSAGVQARDGQAMWPEAAGELIRRGVPTGGFSSRRLTRELIEDADLVLTATRAHRDAAQATAPPAAGRIFTLRELAWLLQDLPPQDVPGMTAQERLAALPAVVAARRGMLRPLPPEQFDIADPVGGPAAVFEVTAEELVLALSPLVSIL